MLALPTTKVLGANRLWFSAFKIQTGRPKRASHWFRTALRWIAALKSAWSRKWSHVWSATVSYDAQFILFRIVLTIVTT